MECRKREFGRSIRMLVVQCERRNGSPELWTHLPRRLHLLGVEEQEQLSCLQQPQLRGEQNLLSEVPAQLHGM